VGNPAFEGAINYHGPKRAVKEGIAPDHITTTCSDQNSMFREGAGMRDAGGIKDAAHYECGKSTR